MAHPPAARLEEGENSGGADVATLAALRPPSFCQPAQPAANQHHTVGAPAQQPLRMLPGRRSKQLAAAAAADARRAGATCYRPRCGRASGRPEDAGAVRLPQSVGAGCVPPLSADAGGSGQCDWIQIPAVQCVQQAGLCRQLPCRMAPCHSSS